MLSHHICPITLMWASQDQMSTGFTFDFILPGEREAQNTTKSENAEDSMKVGAADFCWFEGLESLFLALDDMPHDQITLARDYLCRVRESNPAPQSLRKTDLVPGVYEGGLKIWECSLDLCWYLEENDIPFDGHVLELGCGQGLPGCWILKRALKQQAVIGNGRLGTQLRGMVFSDFNEFVLRDVTIPNILLNTRGHLKDSAADVASWLGRHVALGFGDWNDMSNHISAQSSACPSPVPSDGRFDLVLASETTYSSAAASDTARLVMKHLKVNVGVAYIATKRYYFGVGGGSDEFKAALDSAANPGLDFEVETVMVYDNGAGNIRELLKVRALGR
eukprot:scaffold11926_cov126-Cylindrotheca_fusiformis.AAC.3